MAIDPAVYGLGGAAIAAAVTFFGTVRGGRSDEIKGLWTENRAQRGDIAQLRGELDTERQLRQAAEDRTRAELAASEARCAEQLEQLRDECHDREHQLEVRLAALGGA